MEKKFVVDIYTPTGHYLKTDADYLSVTTGFFVQYHPRGLLHAERHGDFGQQQLRSRGGGAVLAMVRDL